MRSAVVEKHHAAATGTSHDVFTSNRVVFQDITTGELRGPPSGSIGFEPDTVIGSQNDDDVGIAFPGSECEVGQSLHQPGIPVDPGGVIRKYIGKRTNMSPGVSESSAPEIVLH